MRQVRKEALLSLSLFLFLQRTEEPSVMSDGDFRLDT